ncbi:antibiotic biosynthesis monooxygenase [Zavarzinia aquatilis]|uniref:Antibiotic biosynthesis monooxygenase n=2 Tax=Zavarzinia aquatilis TaxID=2211142 RepID=A0A317EEH3_9PROT|nr:antibiotic biosynthesis monooxygenase [Zavarzinia aquatilis]
MLGLIATMRIQDGKTAEFERVFLDLAAKVRANEPGNLTYQLTRSRAEPNTYKVLEIYSDEAAFKAHGASDHFKAAGPALGSVLAGRPDLEILDGIVGA